MGLANPKELRRSSRRRLVPSSDGIVRTPGVMRLAESGQQVAYKPLDVSREGLGIMSEQEILPEFQVILNVGGKDVRLELVWGLQPNKKSPSMRYGFRVLDPDLDLDTLFASAGY